jgi:Tfp pilus assembly protein PilZ
MKTEVWLGQDGIFTRTPETPSDLSEGGAFIETSQRFSLGSILNLRLKLPTEPKPIACTVAVRNQRGLRGIGVQFLDLSRESRQAVSAFVNQYAEAYAAA